MSERAELYRDAMLALLGTQAARLEGRPEDGPLLTYGIPHPRLLSAAILLLNVTIAELAGHEGCDEIDVVRALARRVSLARIVHGQGGE